MDETDAKRQEVEANYHAFQKFLPDLLKSHAGKFALLRQGEVIQYFDTARDAMVFGNTQFPDGIFSVQEPGTSVPGFIHFLCTSWLSQLSV